MAKATKPKNNSPVLSADKTECKVGEVVLRTDQTIEYKGCAEVQTSIGKIKEFKYAGYGQEDTASVWMNVHEMNRENQSEWISVDIWYGHYTNKLFTKNTSEHEPGNKKQTTKAKRPF